MVNDTRSQGLVVVGAADGIGKAAARRLVADGHRVACVDRNEDGLESIVKELGDGAGAFTLDVADEAQVGPTFSSIEEWLGQIHAVVNCAGVTGETGLVSHEVDPTDFDHVVAINLRGAFLVSQAAARRMLPHNYGRILHLASIAGKEGNAGMVSYSASKAGLIGMVKAQGKEYAECGITVNALAPAVIRTSMVEAMPPAQVEYMTKRIPMRRTGTLEECAEMIAWIVSPACSFTTGFTFDLSGGRATY